MGSKSTFFFILPTSSKVAVSKGKNLLLYELILSLTHCDPLETGKMVEIYGSVLIQNNKKQKLNSAFILCWWAFSSHRICRGNSLLSPTPFVVVC